MEAFMLIDTWNLFIIKDIPAWMTRVPFQRLFIPFVFPAQAAVGGLLSFFFASWSNFFFKESKNFFNL